MGIKTELNKLKESDIWSFMLFALFKIRNIPEYSSISELAYVLDKQNLLNLCEYFGGLTIKIPKIEELEVLLYGLLLYQYIHVEKLTYENSIKLIQNDTVDVKSIISSYNKISQLLENYDLVSRGK